MLLCQWNVKCTTKCLGWTIESVLHLESDKNLNIQNGKDYGTNIYLQNWIFLFSLKGFVTHLFLQVPLCFYNKKEQAAAPDIQPPELRSGFAVYILWDVGWANRSAPNFLIGARSLLLQLLRWLHEIKCGNTISPGLGTKQHWEMLAVISIFNNWFSPHSLGILSITQNHIYSILPVLRQFLNLQTSECK